MIAGPELPSSVDEQPPDGPAPRPRPPQRRRPPSRAELKAAQRRAAEAARRRPTRQPAPARRRPVVTEDIDDDAVEREAPAPDPRQKRMVVLMTILTAVVVIASGIAIAVATQDRGDNGPQPAPENTPVPVTVFRDPPNGITLEYPRSWKRVEVPVAEYRLALDAGNNVAFTLRVVPIQTPATAQNLTNFKAVTDGLVASNPTVKVFKEQAISLNGMLGYYYFYTFQDGPVTAVHAHYFLFSGNKMNILVFQTLPDDFEPLAATFDRVAESFRSDPNIPPTSTVPASTTTTAR
ncbi:MAG TPA: hypothetical protein VFK43_02765 [Acidimicrobiales bacterium]|nr:hypothetical protein [Acidimicrobiales bacterium]